MMPQLRYTRQCTTDAMGIIRYGVASGKGTVRKVVAERDRADDVQGHTHCCFRARTDGDVRGCQQQPGGCEKADAWDAPPILSAGKGRGPSGPFAPGWRKELTDGKSLSAGDLAVQCLSSSPVRGYLDRS